MIFVFLTDLDKLKSRMIVFGFIHVILCELRVGEPGANNDLIVQKQPVLLCNKNEEAPKKE